MDRNKIVQYFSKNPIFLQMEYAFKNKKEVTFKINSKMKMAIIIDNMASKGCYLDFNRENLDYALLSHNFQFYNLFGLIESIFEDDAEPFCNYSYMIKAGLRRRLMADFNKLHIKKLSSLLKYETAWSKMNANECKYIGLEQTIKHLNREIQILRQQRRYFNVQDLSYKCFDLACNLIETRPKKPEIAQEQLMLQGYIWYLLNQAGSVSNAKAKLNDRERLILHNHSSSTAYLLWEPSENEKKAEQALQQRKRQAERERIEEEKRQQAKAEKDRQIAKERERQKIIAYHQMARKTFIGYFGEKVSLDSFKRATFPLATQKDPKLIRLLILMKCCNIKVASNLLDHLIDTNNEAIASILDNMYSLVSVSIDSINLTDIQKLKPNYSYFPLNDVICKAFVKDLNRYICSQDTLVKS